MSPVEHSMRARLRDRFPPRLLETVRLVRAKYEHTRFLLRLHRELRKSNHPRGLVASTAPIPRRRPSPRTTILFFPDAPVEATEVFDLCARLGFAITTNPTGPWDVAFKWRDDTFFDRSLLDWLPKDVPMINRESVDISKTTVDRAMQEVFGYCAAVDPTQYVGPAVRKSDRNGAHDGRVIHCPVPRESLKAGYVYQKLIDTTLAPGIVYGYRVPIHGRRMPYVALLYRSIRWRFGARQQSRRFRVGASWRMAEPDQVFSEEELGSIWAFVRRVGLNYGALDILRDRSDGRIYVLDANNTPSFGTRRRRRPRRLYPRLMQSFAEMIQEFRRRDVARGRAGPAGRPAEVLSADRRALT